MRRAKNDPEGGGAMLYLHRDTVKLVRAAQRVGDRDRCRPGEERMVQRYGSRNVHGAAQPQRLQKRK